MNNQKLPKSLIYKGAKYKKVGHPSSDLPKATISIWKDGPTEWVCELTTLDGKPYASHYGVGYSIAARGEGRSAAGAIADMISIWEGTGFLE